MNIVKMGRSETESGFCCECHVPTCMRVGTLLGQLNVPLCGVSRSSTDRHNRLEDLLYMYFQCSVAFYCVVGLVT